MKFKVFIILLLSALLLGCESEKEVDEKVLKYISENHDFKINILEREEVNEANGGNRIYKVESREKPKIEFNIKLRGIFNTKVVGDDYELLKNTYLSGEKFSQIYKEQLSKLKFSDIKFYYKYGMYSGIYIYTSYEKSVSVFNDQSMKPLLQLLDLLNSFIVDENIKQDFEKLEIEFNGRQETIDLADTFYPTNQVKLENINTMKELKTRLLKNQSLVNDSLLMRDKLLYIELEKQLKELGYTYNSSNFDKRPLICYDDNLKNGECIGGYRLYLKGESVDKKKLFEVIKILNSSTSLVFDEVIIDSNKENVDLQDVKGIHDMTQIEKLLKDENK